jgi:ribosome-associated heat shock protein Hsp15
MRSGPFAAPEASNRRLDAWLWHARIRSSRADCAALIATSGVRINGRMTEKPGTRLNAGDVLTLAAGGRVRVLKVLGFAARRGDTTTAAALYLDLAGGTVADQGPPCTAAT